MYWSQRPQVPLGTASRTDRVILCLWPRRVLLLKRSIVGLGRMANVCRPCDMRVHKTAQTCSRLWPVPCCVSGSTLFLAATGLEEYTAATQAFAAAMNANENGVGSAEAIIRELLGEGDSSDSKTAVGIKRVSQH